MRLGDHEWGRRGVEEGTGGKRTHNDEEGDHGDRVERHMTDAGGVAFERMEAKKQHG